MIQSLFSAAHGVAAQQRRLDVIANNMANVNTNGFKSTRVDFKDMLYQVLRNPGTGDQSDNSNPRRGHGVMVSATNRDYSQGSLITTGLQLDLALADEGFFKVQNSNGTVQYIRDGSFKLSHEGNTNYLVDQHGYYVLDASDQRIRIDGDINTLTISSDGSMAYGQQGTVFARIAVYTAPNIDGLAAVGANGYVPTDSSGNMVRVEQPDIRQGMLENSNVDMALEMTRVIRTQRAFSLAGKAMTTADDMEGIANNMRST